MITKQDEILVTLHNEFDKKVGKKVFKRISDARNFAEMALKQYPEIKSYRILDVIYNSKHQ